MRISQIITKLQAIQSEHGDIIVTAHRWDSPHEPGVVKDVRVLAAKPRYPDTGDADIYVKVRELAHGGWGGRRMFEDDYYREIRKRKSEKIVYLYYDA